MAHTLFNVTNVIVLAFFIPLLARLCEKLIPSKEASRTCVLEPHLLVTPELALHAARLALADMTRRAWTVASAALASAIGKTKVAEEAVVEAEKGIDRTQTEIRDYLVRVSRQKLSERQAAMIPELIHCVNDAERISDLAVKIFRKGAKLRKGTLAPFFAAKVGGLISQVRAFANVVVAALRKGEPMTIDSAAAESEIKSRARLISHSDGVPLELLSLLAAVRDITRHLDNIATRVNGI